MQTPELSPIIVETTVNASLKKAWEVFNEPEHIKQWAFASDDWYVPYSENDLRVGGKIKSTLAAKDGSFSFDFEGTYTRVEPHHTVEYVLGDGRTVKITFEAIGDTTKVTETFDPESSNPREMQQGGWQAMLNNFKKHAEASV
jgi:uncharacterized protein YndB with AHSA1/START domain